MDGAVPAVCALTSVYLEGACRTRRADSFHSHGKNTEKLGTTHVGIKREVIGHLSIHAFNGIVDLAHGSANWVYHGSLAPSGETAA